MRGRDGERAENRQAMPASLVGYADQATRSLVRDMRAGSRSVRVPLGALDNPDYD